MPHWIVPFLDHAPSSLTPASIMRANEHLGGHNPLELRFCHGPYTATVHIPVVAVWIGWTGVMDRTTAEVADFLEFLTDVAVFARAMENHLTERGNT